MIKITRKEFQKLLEVTLDDTDFDAIVDAALEDQDNVTVADVQKDLEDRAADAGANIPEDFDTEGEIESKLATRPDLDQQSSFSVVTEASRSDIRKIINEEIRKLSRHMRR